MKITTRQLRSLIREVLIKEQVVGYTAPEEKGMMTMVVDT